MSTPNPLQPLGDLAQPVNTLIEKVSNAIEGWARPKQTIRMAKAQAEANKILAMSDIEITELQQRAMTRFVLEETKKQANMEAILQKALPEVTEDAHPEQIEEDWVVHFFDKCRLVSNEDMQNLWAQVLAGQANAPGSFSKRTLDVLANLEQSDAVLFSNLARYCIVTETGLICPLIYGLNLQIYSQYGIRFSQMSHLESLGLLHVNGSAFYHLNNVSAVFSVNYFDTEFKLHIPQTQDVNHPLHPPGSFQAGKVMVSRVGEELLQMSDAKPVEGFVDYLLEVWSEFGYRPEIVPDLSDSDEPSPSEDDSTAPN